MTFSYVNWLIEQEVRYAGGKTGIHEALRLQELAGAIRHEAMWKFTKALLLCGLALYILRQGRRENGRGPGQIQKAGPIHRLCKGGLGARPHKILRFYML